MKKGLSNLCSDCSLVKKHQKWQVALFLMPYALLTVRERIYLPYKSVHLPPCSKRSAFPQ